MWIFKKKFKNFIKLNYFFFVKIQVQSALEQYDLEGIPNVTEIYFYPMKLYTIGERKRSLDNTQTILVTFILEYLDPDEINSADLKILIRNALKKGDQCILPINTNSISIQQLYPGKFIYQLFKKLNLITIGNYTTNHT